MNRLLPFPMAMQATSSSSARKPSFGQSPRELPQRFMTLVDDVAAGNPGALNCVTQIINHCEPAEALVLIGTLQQADITGSRLACAFQVVCDSDVQSLSQKILREDGIDPQLLETLRRFFA